MKNCVPYNLHLIETKNKIHITSLSFKLRAYHYHMLCIEVLNTYIMDRNISILFSNYIHNELLLVRYRSYKKCMPRAITQKRERFLAACIFLVYDSYTRATDHCIASSLNQFRMEIAACSSLRVISDTNQVDASHAAVCEL